MSSRSWVTSSMVGRPEIFCWVSRGYAALGDAAGGPDRRVVVEPGRGILAVTAELPQIPAWPASGRRARRGSARAAPAARADPPDGRRVALGRVLIVPDQVGETCLVGGDV